MDLTAKYMEGGLCREKTRGEARVGCWTPLRFRHGHHARVMMRLEMAIDTATEKDSYLINPHFAFITINQHSPHLSLRNPQQQWAKTIPMQTSTQRPQASQLTPSK